MLNIYFRKTKQKNEVCKGRKIPLGGLIVAEYSLRVLSKNNLVNMWTENHRPQLSPEHMQL